MQRSAGDLDHNLAERAARQMLVGLDGFLERVHLVDDGTDAMFVEEGIHAVEGGTRGDGDG